QRLSLDLVKLADRAPHPLCGLEEGGGIHQRFGFAGIGIFPALAQHADHGLADRKVPGRSDCHDALAGLGEYVQLAEGRDVVDPRIGACIGEHHEAISNENATAVSHAGGTTWSAWLGLYSRVATAWANTDSILRLLCRLGDADFHRQHFAPAPMSRTAQRGCPEIVQSDRDPHMSIGAADAIRCVESNPAKLRHARFRPG